MATVTAFQGLDMSNLSLNRLISGFQSSYMADNTNAPFNGNVYTDVYQLNWGINGYNMVSHFGGPQITYNSSWQPTGGTVTAYVESVSTGNSLSPVYSIEGVNIFATSLINASYTASNADEYLIIGNALSGADTLQGSAYNDTLWGFGGNDVFVSSAGNDTYTGGTGYNTVIYSGRASDYSINKNGTISTVADHITGRDGVDGMSDIAQIKFSDVTVVLDHSAAIDTTVYLLYQAAFARMPDNAGFNFWANTAEANGLSALQLADNFISSQEFSNLFGSNPTNAEFVNKLYTNVLGREPDKAGLDFWTHAADAGRPYDQLLVDFALSNENVVGTTGHVNNGFWTI